MQSIKPVPSIRIRRANRRQVNAGGSYVLYWMIANRRTGWNFALDRAVQLAVELEKPLLVLEALRAGYRWAGDRFHLFVARGMEENRRVFEEAGVRCLSYLEPAPGDGKGLLESLAKSACVVVTDEFPCFFLPRMIEKAAGVLDVRMEAVDSAGLLPVRAADRVFSTAYSFRRFLQKRLPEHLGDRPAARPLDFLPRSGKPEPPPETAAGWPSALGVVSEDTVAGIPVDHGVGPGVFPGGAGEAAARLERFASEVLPVYHERRNETEGDFTSGLSPYLHFGHVSSHEIFDRVSRAEGWSPDRLSPAVSGGRSGWWGLSEGAEAFLDQLVTWRELGFNMCAHGSGWDRYESLPGWAADTLRAHEKDPREHVYRLEDFEAAGTHDPLWNAAQVQLLIEGRIHNYLRMLWGKKILEWSRSPAEALEVMIRLNNKYALDGRDPNSYSGIFWVLGRYDRAWGPERQVFGKVRYMSSENTARKLRVKDYIAKYKR